MYAILFSLVFALFLIFITGYLIAAGFSDVINVFLHASTYKVVAGKSGVSPVYYPSAYPFMNTESADRGERLFQEDMRLAEEVESEGATLLWNDENALPLSRGNKVTLLGRGSERLVETGSGSGYIASSAYSVTLKAGLEAAGLSVNEKTVKFYSSRPFRTERKSSCTEWASLSVNETDWSEFSDAILSSFSDYGDAAIVVLSRSGGEGSDLKDCGNERPDGKYLALTQQEELLLENVSLLRKNGTFAKTVLLINSGNPLETDALFAYRDSVDACLYIGQLGTCGAGAVADLLAGNVVPSGRLTDTWAYRLDSAPSSANDGDYSYEGFHGFSDAKGAPLSYQQIKYMVYQEGIYVGYRYYETRYADSVTGSGNASSFVGTAENTEWEYGREVAFPFGFGLSYTAFEYGQMQLERERDGAYLVSVPVTNTGAYAAKEVVQIYLQRPYTDYDRENGLEQSAVFLVGFTKTPEIKPNRTYTAKIRIDDRFFATYDPVENNGYVTEGGAYYLSAGKNAHDALNHILAHQGKSTADGMDAEGDRTLCRRIDRETDTKTYEFSRYDPNVKVMNRFACADTDSYASMASSDYKPLSRRDWSGTYPAKSARLKMTKELALDLTYDKEIEEDPSATMPAYGKDNGLTVAMAMREPYDSDVWEDLLDQMTFEEQALLCANAYHKTEGAVSVGLNQTRAENGPVGLTKRSDFPKPKGNDYVHIAYPCAPIVAGTWNEELVYRLGVHIGEDMLYTGYQGIYGPGLNLHRTPFGGRNWEYFSEDGYLSGVLAAAQCRGTQSKGCISYVKHFVMNDLETNRRHAGIWCGEQAIREIYLLPFEIVFADENGDAAASGCMNSFTRLGATWCGASSDLLVSVLREEWNWKGIVISDWDTGGTMSKTDGILNGTDSFDGNNKISCFEPYRDSPTLARAIRTATKHIVYNVAHTNVMNGIAEDSVIVHILPWWKTVLLCVTGAFGAGALGSGVLFVVAARKERRERDEKEE